MSNPTQIVNLALVRIGAKAIQDIDDTDNRNARQAKILFQPTFEELARAAKWNCLTTRADLAQVSPGPAWGWDYKYQLPSTCYRLLTVNGYDITEAQDGFEIEGREILTNAEECKITYIQDETDPNIWDRSFQAAFVVLLASKLAVQTRQDEQLAERLYAEYSREVLPRAMRIDGNERRKRLPNLARESKWVKARHISTKG